MRIVRRLMLALVALALVGATAVSLTAWHQGYRIYIVHTGSMVPTLNPGDAVLDRPAPKAVRPGEVITFTATSGPDAVVTHRVASVDNGLIKTKGDANATIDPWTTRISGVVGDRLLDLPKVGYLLVFFKQPTGSISMVCFLIALICAWTLFFGGSGEKETARRRAAHAYLVGKHRAQPVAADRPVGPRHGAARRQTGLGAHPQPAN